jgi:hypothetical protein
MSKKSKKPVNWQKVAAASEELIEKLSTQPDRQMLEDLDVIDGEEADRLVLWLRQVSAVAKLKVAG